MPPTDARKFIGDIGAAAVNGFKHQTLALE
jgi:hypothetical protein